MILYYLGSGGWGRAVAKVRFLSLHATAHTSHVDFLPVIFTRASRAPLDAVRTQS